LVLVIVPFLSLLSDREPAGCLIVHFQQSSAGPSVLHRPFALVRSFRLESSRITELFQPSLPMKYSTVHTYVRDVATSKLASDLSSGSKKPEPDNSVPTSEIYSWARQVAFESRRAFWLGGWYVCPEAISRIIKRLETMRGGIVGLIGRPATSRNGQAYERLGAGG
jgi:hypothetical protein